MGFMVLGYRVFVTVTCFTASLRERYELLAVLDSTVKGYGSCNCHYFHMTLFTCTMLEQSHNRSPIAIAKVIIKSMRRLQ